VSDKWYFCPSSSYVGAPVHEGEVLIGGQWHPAAFEGNTPADSVIEAFLPWVRPRVEAARINGMIYMTDERGRITS
jgi:hypothetical protein